MTGSKEGLTRKGKTIKINGWKSTLRAGARERAETAAQAAVMRRGDPPGGA
jgi:hypothetical protein